jgi:tetraacyldisaccharide 4'-kinase
MKAKIMWLFKHTKLSSFLSQIFAYIVSFRNYLYDNFSYLSKTICRPTISVGSINAGGTGKTPMALLVAKYYYKNGYEIAFLSRGYKRLNKKMVICEPNSYYSWEDIGDEPAMLHAELKESWVGISANRFSAAKQLCKLISKNTIFILDDGFQHRKIKRNLDIICVDKDIFSAKLIPSGNLREPIENLKRANIICVIGIKQDEKELNDVKKRIIEYTGNNNTFSLYQKPLQWYNLNNEKTSAIPPFQKSILISGIANPSRFLKIVQEMGICIVENYFFKDHHVFCEKDLINLINNSKTAGIITTQKDAIRLKSLKLVNSFDIWYLKIELDFFYTSEKEKFENILYGLVKQKNAL